MANTIPGIHHITSISSDPQRNLDFYTEVLGLRLIKITVNFDVPGTYHFYYGDEVGTPGTILTIFPWPHLSRRPPGTGQVVVTSFAIPTGSTGYWVDRLTRLGVTVERPAARFDEEVITFADHDGLQYELVMRDDGPAQRVWGGGPIPAEHAIRGFHGATLWVRTLEPTARLLTDLMGFRLVAEERERLRFAVGEGTSRAMIDVVSPSSAPRGEEGTGTVHHIAWRTPNDAEQQAWRERLIDAGFDVTPVRDRQYFRSIYFREPGGVLFEIATDGPGFTVDEPVEELGTSLKLPPWYEPRRAEIERALPPLERLVRSTG